MATPTSGNEVKFHYVSLKSDYENPNFVKNDDTVYFIGSAREIYIGSNLMSETRPKWLIL